MAGNDTDREGNLRDHDIWHGRGVCVDLQVITPSDTEDHKYDCLYIGSGGDLVVTPRDAADGTKITLKNIGDGEWQPLSVKRVWADGGNTTCDDILGGIKES